MYDNKRQNGKNHINQITFRNKAPGEGLHNSSFQQSVRYILSIFVIVEGGGLKSRTVVK